MALISMRKVGSYYKQGYGPRKNAIEDYRSYGNQVGWEKEVLEDLLDSIQNGKEGVDFVFTDSTSEGEFNEKTKLFFSLVEKKLGPERDVKAWRIRNLEKILLKETLVKGETRKSFYRSSPAKNWKQLDCVELADEKIGWRYVKVTISANRPCWIIVFHMQENDLSEEDGWWRY